MAVCLLDAIKIYLVLLEQKVSQATILSVMLVGDIMVLTAMELCMN